MQIFDFAADQAPTLVTIFIAVFVIDYIANLISFGNRIVSALVTALVLMVVQAVLLVVLGERVEFPLLLTAGGVMFVIALLGNVLTFRNRIVNALVTAVIFLIPFTLAYYYLVGLAQNMQLGG